ncbi:Nucleolar protein 56 [Cladobotryum mycophilum]|uniref:Nucleolar protein 56 n=1 Tax=Cladobotryum mycophilum TaxID=491253 RepID=A0ABR0STG2_9HYPO
MAHVDYALFEAPVGYGLFKVEHQADAVGLKMKEVQEASNDLARFGKMVQLVNFTPFRYGIPVLSIMIFVKAEALANTNDVSEGIVSDQLKAILELNLPKTSGKKGKKSKIVLGVAERNLAGSIKAAFPGLECETPDTSAVVGDLLRGIRLHAEKLLNGLKSGDLLKASLGMGHAYSRAKVKFSVTRNDNHIIQASATIEFQDKGVNLFSMRLREWYGKSFPELEKIVSDNMTYAKLVKLIQDKKSLTQDSLHDLAAVLTEDGEKAQAIIDASKVSMGQDLAARDFEIISGLANLVITQAGNRQATSTYLDNKLATTAPNVQAVVGSNLAARLISKAGSLTNLAKMPSSTVQVMGSEKALFRALKTKSATPKYGVLYHSGFIAKAAAKNKGRISRYLANKVSMASRIDMFSEEPSARFGQAFKQQIEDRLAFYEDGKRPAKNLDVMKSVIASLGDADEAADEEMVDAPEPASAKKEKKDKKKDKKEKKEDKKEKKEDKKEKKEKKENKRKRDEEEEEAPVLTEASASVESTSEVTQQGERDEEPVKVSEDEKKLAKKAKNKRAKEAKRVKKAAEQANPFKHAKAPALAESTSEVTQQCDLGEKPVKVSKNLTDKRQEMKKGKEKKKQHGDEKKNMEERAFVFATDGGQQQVAVAVDSVSLKRKLAPRKQSKTQKELKSKVRKALKAQHKTQLMDQLTTQREAQVEKKTNKAKKNKKSSKRT